MATTCGENVRMREGEAHRLNELGPAKGRNCRKWL